MSVELEMRVQELEIELRLSRLARLELGKFLAGALCAVCGEELGASGPDNTITSNDDDRTIHARCEDKT